MRKNKGITLIVLVITIIILLILAGVTIAMLTGENGLLNMAEKARKTHEEEQEKELDDLEKLYSSILVATNDSSQVTINVEDLKTLINKTVEEKLTENSAGPTGTVISYMGNNVPNGYLKCDGTTYNITDYPKLAEQIKTEFGSYNYYGGDGTTTFAVPDLRGEFLRGTGTATRNKGSGASVGTHQDPTNHAQVFNVINSSTDTRMFMGASANMSNPDTYYGYTKRWNSGQATGAGVMTNESGSGTYTSRPTNTSVLYCIKF